MIRSSRKLCRPGQSRCQCQPGGLSAAGRGRSPSPGTVTPATRPRRGRASHGGRPRTLMISSISSSQFPRAGQVPLCQLDSDLRPPRRLSYSARKSESESVTDR